MKLIDKDAIIAEIKKHQAIWDGMDDDYCKGQRLAYSDVISFLDTLEAKEVDLEKELETLDSLLYDLAGVAVKGTTSYLTVEDVKDIAKRFFELGLTQKRE